MEEQTQPWERLSALVEEGDAAGVTALLAATPAADTPRLVAHLDGEESAALLELLHPEGAAAVVELLPDEQAADILPLLDPNRAAAILQELWSNDQADLLAELDQDEADAILAAFDPIEARAARALAAYDSETAGGLMVTELLAYREDRTVREVHDDLRAHADRYRDYDVQYLYTVDAHGRLTGVVPMRELVLSRREERIGAIARRDPERLGHDAELAALEAYFDNSHFVGVPVVDDQDRLLGVVRRGALEEALGERAEDDFRKAQGIVGGEELRTMPLATRSGWRLSWLSVNIVLNVIAASVIAAYEDTLRAVIALAVFLPIISDMSGCSGNQAVAVSIRELTLGLVKPSDAWWVWRKELFVGLLNGCALGALLAAVAWAWKGNPWLGLVVGGALAVNTVIAVSVGGLIPLLLVRFRLDPALASGPILTTLTDMCGFVAVLALATRMLPLL